MPNSFLVRGKTSVAKIFAKAMNCPNQRLRASCNDCYIWQAITGSLECLSKSTRSLVVSMRFVIFRPTRAPKSRYAVYIIDEVHALDWAFNACSRPWRTDRERVFILATTKSCIRFQRPFSRVQRFEFKSIKAQTLLYCCWVDLSREGIDFGAKKVCDYCPRAVCGMPIYPRSAPA